jgi:hypothetical protein
LAAAGERSGTPTGNLVLWFMEVLLFVAMSGLENFPDQDDHQQSSAEDAFDDEHLEIRISSGDSGWCQQPCSPSQPQVGLIQFAARRRSDEIEQKWP